MPRSKQAIAEDLAKRLPAPFDDIRFQWDILSLHCDPDMDVRIEYIGAPNRLIECGAIEPAMAGKSKAKSRPRVDSAGHYYHRELRVDPDSMTHHLKITRYITDPKFAETLPGAPRGLRFKRLDWLDAHPNRVHIAKQVTKRDTKNQWVVTRTAGTVENLLAAGFPKSYFEQKFTACSRSHCLYRDLPANAYGRISCLMRGYFDVQIEVLEAIPDMAEFDRKPSRPTERPSFLRLAIDNTKGASVQA